MRFRDQVVVVTGAARSIGRAIAEAFVAEGARVIAVNLRGPYLCTRYAAPLLRASGAGGACQ